MKAASQHNKTLRDEYRRGDFPAGFVRGKHAKQVALASNISIIEPARATAFPNLAAVNNASRGILKMQEKMAGQRN